MISQHSKDNPIRLRAVKKHPVVHGKAAFNELYIKGSRPLQVYRRHAEKVLTKSNSIILHGMTAAINKVIKLYVHFKKQYPYLLEEVVTDSVPTIVEFEDGTKQIRQKSALHITLTKNCSKGD